MDLIDNVINSTIDAFKFKDTVILKENSDLQDKYNALQKLINEYPDNEDLKNEIFIVKKGLDGENEISYQLKKAHIGMYVLRDIKVKYEDLTAQIDYVVITPAYTYFIECKNLIGNITVNENGDFIREYTINGKKVKKGMYSPLRQVEAQREVIRKIWEKNASKLEKFLGSKKFEYYRRVLVVATNKDTILNKNRAPKNIKNNILKADALVRKMEYDFNHREKDEYILSKNEMEKKAKYYMNISISDLIDYYKYYKEKYCICDNISNDMIKSRLLVLRKIRSKEMNIPAYYVFNNDELDKLVETKPKTIEELKSLNILSDIKIKTHGKYIISEINKK